MPRPAPPHRYERRACLWARADRASRALTQAYNRALAPAGLTIAQFGALAYLLQSRNLGREQVLLSVLADFVGTRRSTLRRHLRALKAEGLVADAANPAPPRGRAVRITDLGGARLVEAMPLWAGAQAQLQATLGNDATRALNGLFDIAAAKLPT